MTILWVLLIGRFWIRQTDLDPDIQRLNVTKSPNFKRFKTLPSKVKKYHFYFNSF